MLELPTSRMLFCPLTNTMNNTEQHIEIWNSCLSIIENIIEPQKFNMWFKPLKPVSFKDSTITLEVPTESILRAPISIC